MIKILYKEKCLRYFIILEIILFVIVNIVYFPLGTLILWIWFLFGGIRQILIYLLFKMIVIYFSFKKFQKINKIQDEVEKKKFKNRGKIIIFMINVIIFSVFLIFFVPEIKEITNITMNF